MEKYKLKSIQLRSEEVQELMGKIPPCIMRYGITIISLILLFFLITSYYIKYPEYSNVIIEVFPKTPTYEIKSTIDGYVRNIINSTEECVSIGDTLATIYTTDSYIILKSPITGIAYKCNFYQPHRKVTKNDILFIVTPKGSIDITGIANIPPNIIDNINIGQDIEVHLENNKPLIGKIIKKSSILNPNNGYYAVELSFDANIQKHIISKEKGTATIETSKKTVFEHLFKRFTTK